MPTRRKNLKKTLRKKLKKSRKLFRGGAAAAAAAAEENEGILTNNNTVFKVRRHIEVVCPTASQIIKYSIPNLRNDSISYSLESVRKEQKKYILKQLESHTLDSSITFPQLMDKLREMHEHKKNKDLVEKIIKEVCKIGGPKSFGDASFFLATFLVQMHGTRSALLSKISSYKIPYFKSEISNEDKLPLSLKCYNNKSGELKHELKLPTLETLDFERGVRKKMSSCILSLLSLNDNEPPSLALCCLKACIIDPQGNIRMSPDKFNILQIFKIKKDLYKKEIDINNEKSVAEFLININLCVFYHMGTGNLCVIEKGIDKKSISADEYAIELKKEAKIERELDFRDFDEVNEILHLINAATRLDSVLHMLSIYNIYSSLASHDMDNVQAPIRNYFIEECLKKMGFIVTKETPISKLFPFNMVTGKTLSGSPVPLAIINNNCQGRIYMVSHILSSISNTNYSPPLSFGMPYTCYTHANMGNIVCGLGFEKKTIEWPNSNLNFSVAAKDENEHVVYLSFDEKLKEKFDWVPTFMWNDESNLLFIPTEIVSEIGVTIGTIIKRNYGNFHEMMTKPSLSKLKAALNTKLKGYIEGQIFKEYNAIKAQKNSNVFYSFLNKYENFMLAYERIFHDYVISSEPIDDIAEEIISKFLQINKETERLTGLREAAKKVEITFTPFQSEQAAEEAREDIAFLQKKLREHNEEEIKKIEMGERKNKLILQMRGELKELKKLKELRGDGIQPEKNNRSRSNRSRSRDRGV